MSLEDESALWRRFKEQGDGAAREQLIVHYMRVVKYIAGRMAIHVPQSVDMNDLVGWGMIGLMDAAEKFDHTQAIKFSTYASIRIRGAILDQIRALDWAPRSLRAMARKLGAAREELRQELGQEPSMDAIAGKLGAPVEDIEDTLAQLQTAQTLSLDDYLPSEDEGDLRKRDVTSDAAAPSPSHIAESEEKKALLVQAILALPEQQQKVLNLYYYEELTLKEIGAVLHVTESRICQVHGAAMKALRKAIQART